MNIKAKIKERLTEMNENLLESSNWDSLSYEEAKKIKKDLDAASHNSGHIINNNFPKGSIGITPDAIRATSEYKQAKMKADKDFANLRAFNGFFVKKFSKEYKKERDTARMGKP